MFPLVYDFWQIYKLPEIIGEAIKVIYLKDPIGVLCHHYPEELKSQSKQPQGWVKFSLDTISDSIVHT